MQGTPDRNTGLWDKVQLESTGVVTITDPAVRTVALLDITAVAAAAANYSTSNVAKFATLGAVAGLKYRGGGAASVVRGTLRCTITPVGVLRKGKRSTNHGMEGVASPVTIEIPDIKLAAGDTIEEVKFPLLNITAPQLWNPWTHGVPFLYSASFEFVVDSAGGAGAGAGADAGAGAGAVDTDANAVGENIIASGGEQVSSLVLGMKEGQEKKEPFISDTATINFGIRTTESFIHPTTKGRAFKVNGVEVFLTGGNWITTDQFLRYATSKVRYYNEVRMHREMGTF